MFLAHDPGEHHNQTFINLAQVCVKYYGTSGREDSPEINENGEQSTAVGLQAFGNETID
jgi:hypothetical protein